MRRLSVRARITIGSLVVAMVLLSLALLIVRSQVGTVLSDADAVLAQSDLTAFERDITANPTAEVDNPGTGVLVFVRNPAGAVQVNTLPHDIDRAVGSRPATTQQFEFTDDEGRDFIVIGREVTTNAGTWALWSARSTSSSELALAGLDRVLLVGGIILLLAFGAASWLLATVALRPVARMRKQAEALGTTLDGELPVGGARDELAALASTLNELLARLRASSAREKQMISDAAHELRTPLASLTTQLELAHDDAGNADALAERLRGAEASAGRLAALATNLLELNRLEIDGREPTTSTDAELTTELMGAIDRARMLGLARSVDVGFDVRGVPHQQRYRIDPHSFGRILDNLLVNAIHAVATGGTIEVGLDQGASGLLLTVTDDGPGMPEEFLAKAFERFSRPDAGRSTSAGGSGLGLALVQAIVVSAGGTVLLRNLSHGFVVEVQLPQM
ncbi:MAG: HAMP domain-containing histidine kinase [Actinomycetota bacterium]|nr:HAMP domain-containing histidine kinase [Actinomycetota bacterium]